MLWLTASVALAAALVALLGLRGGGRAAEGERTLVRLAAEAGRSVVCFRGRELTVDGLPQDLSCRRAGDGRRALLILAPGPRSTLGTCRTPAGAGAGPDPGSWDLDVELAPGRVYELGPAPGPPAPAPPAAALAFRKVPAPGGGDFWLVLTEIDPP